MTLEFALRPAPGTRRPAAGTSRRAVSGTPAAPSPELTATVIYVNGAGFVTQMIATTKFVPSAAGGEARAVPESHAAAHRRSDAEVWLAFARAASRGDREADDLFDDVVPG